MQLQKASWQVLLIAVIAAVIQFALTAEAVDANFTETSGYWTNASAWSTTPVGNTAYIGRTVAGSAPVATCIVDTAGQNCAELRLGYTAPDKGILNMTGGSLAISSNSYIGYGGTGIVTQVSGTWNNGGGSLRLGETSSGDGTYNLSGDGVLTNVNEVLIGFDGRGSVTLSGSVKVYSNFRIHLGKSSSRKGSGEVTQTGGYWDAKEQHWYIASQRDTTGTYNLSGDGVVTNINSLHVGSQGNGTLNLSGSGKFYTGCGGGYVSMPFSSLGRGTVVQSDDSLWDTGGGAIYIGGYDGNINATGTYTISSGVLTNCGTLYVGRISAGTGRFYIEGSSASIHVTTLEMNAASTISVNPDSGGLSPINVDGTVDIFGTLEVDLSGGYDGRGPLTLIDYKTLAGSTVAFSATNILTEFWSATLTNDTANTRIDLINIQGPAKGTVITIR